MLHGAGLLLTELKAALSWIVNDDRNSNHLSIGNFVSIKHSRLKSENLIEICGSEQTENEIDNFTSIIFGPAANKTFDDFVKCSVQHGGFTTIQIKTQTNGNIPHEQGHTCRYNNQLHVSLNGCSNT